MSTRLLFATDFHGSEQVFRKFLNAAKMFEVDACILGGDISGKVMVPIVEEPGQSIRRAEFMGTEHVVHDDAELTDLMKRIRFNGQYPFCASADEYAALSEDQTRQQMVFERLMLEEMERWLVLAEERLSPLRIKCYVTGGNDDPFVLEEALLNAQSDWVIAAEGKVIQLDEDHEMVSCGYGNITPWACPRDISEGDLLEKLEERMAGLSNVQNAILNFHIPPHSCTLDACAKLDTSVYPPRPKIGEFIAAGSTAVRAIVDKYQPMLILCGHIHEARGAVKLGRTECMNPGSEYSEGVLRAVVVNLDHQRVLSHQFISG